MLDPSQLMQLAIEKAQAGIAAGQSPFGCAIARDGKLLAVAHNTVLANTDITAHAEVNVLRDACLSTGDIFLEGAIVACTCEPCPMCMAASHWARVETVYYGASIADATAAGFNELHLPAAELVRVGRSNISLKPDLLAETCRDLFDQWRAGPSARSY